MRPRDPDLDFWHLVPADPRDQKRFRQWNVTIITLLAVLVLGLLLVAILPRVTVNPVSASHTGLKNNTQLTP